MNLSCSKCNQPFGPIGSKSASRLLLCGDSYCDECVDHLTNNCPKFTCTLDVNQASNVRQTSISKATFLQLTKHTTK